MHIWLRVSLVRELHVADEHDIGDSFYFYGLQCGVESASYFIQLLQAAQFEAGGGLNVHQYVQAITHFEEANSIILGREFRNGLFEALLHCLLP